MLYPHGHFYLLEFSNKPSIYLYSVVGAPKPKQGANVFRVVGFLGMPINLLMNSQGYPYPTFTWSHNGRVLPSNMHVDFEWFSLLNLTRLKAEDFGKYSLKMSNSIGTYTADYEVVSSGELIKIVCFIIFHSNLPLLFNWHLLSLLV